MLAAALAAFAMAAPAPAQTWPEKPVRLVVAFAPGGLIDMSERLGALIKQRNIGSD